MDDRRLDELRKDMQDVKLQVARIVSHLESERESRKEIRAMIEKHTHIIFGNGEPGFKTRLDRIEQSESNRTWHIRAVWAAILTMLARIGHDIFRQ